MATEPAANDSTELLSLDQMAKRLQGRLTNLTTRCNQAEAEAKSLSDQVKGVQAIRKEFAKIAGLTDPRIIAMARTAYESALRIEQEILGMQPGIQHGIELRREFYEAWAYAWGECESLTATPADEWYDAMASERDQFRAWREEAIQRMKQGERRWLSEGSQPVSEPAVAQS